MTGSMSGKEKHDAEHRQGSLPFRLDSCALLQSWRPQVVDLVAPINHDAILLLAREYSRGYSSLSSHSYFFDEKSGVVMAPLHLQSQKLPHKTKWL